MKNKTRATFSSHRTWFTADTHYGHRGVLKMENRPWDDIARHDDDLIYAHNSTVRPGDEVFHLGDFAMNASAERCQEIFSRLKGNLHLVIGNHDGPRHLALGWASAPEMLRTIHLDGIRLVLCHYGMRTWSGAWRGALHLYGHSHGKLTGTSRSCDVGVDAWAYRPVSLPEIRERLAATPTAPEEQRIEADDAAE